MAEWLKHGFKSEINAAVRRTEVEATQVQVGTAVGASSPPNQRRSKRFRHHHHVVQEPRGHELGRPAIATPADKTPVALEPTVVLDEQSNYLNHLNQLRRINAGDELADRPGYGLYLVRIPVTLVTRAPKPPGQGSDHHRLGEVGHDQGHAQQRPAERGDQRNGQQPDPGHL